MPARHMAVIASAAGSVLCVAALSWSTAQPAAAHFGGGKPYVTAITSIQPAIPGLEVSTSRDGNWLTVTNKTTDPVTVLGYAHEPYLKITDHGVWEDTNSPTSHLNREPSIGNIPDTPDMRDMTRAGNPPAPPHWQRIADSNRYRYHDHRTHRSGKTRPPVVAQNPGQPHLIKTWTIDLLVGTTPVTVTGTLKWLPASNTALEWLFAMICVALLIGFGVATAVDTRRTPTTDPRRERTAVADRSRR